MQSRENIVKYRIFSVLGPNYHIFVLKDEKEIQGIQKIQHYEKKNSSRVRQPLLPTPITYLYPIEILALSKFSCGRVILIIKHCLKTKKQYHNFQVLLRVKKSKCFSI